MKKIVLIENNLGEILNNYIVKNNKNIENMEINLTENIKVYIILHKNDF